MLGSKRGFLKGLFLACLGVVLPLRVAALRVRKGWVLRKED